MIANTWTIIMTVQDNSLTATRAAVAHQVRALRQARGWSLEELGQRAGVSKGMLVQIENARTNPSIGTLCRLAESFGVSIARLVEPDPERERVRIIDAEEPKVLWRGAHGGLARLLAGVNDPAFVEFWEWRISPGERHGSAEHTPGTRELVHLRAGALVVTVDGTDHPVRAGQTIDFRADRPHGYRNDGAEPADAAMVVIMPPGEWDRRRSARTQ
jgi:transcriptional regulator with XRE-family HTH domain